MKAHLLAFWRVFKRAFIDFLFAVVLALAAPFLIAIHYLSGDLTTKDVEWRHKKRGSKYTILHEGERAFIEAGAVPCVIYKSKDDGVIWVRPSDEFFDGRFEKLESTAL